MKGSTFFQAVLAEGWAKGWAKGWAEGERTWADTGGDRSRSSGGSRRFGLRAVEIIAEWEAIHDHDRLCCIAGRIVDATSWEDYLAVD